METIVYTVIGIFIIAGLFILKMVCDMPDKDNP